VEKEIIIPNFSNNDNEILMSDFHTLITTKIQEERIPAQTEDGLPVEGFYEIVPEYEKLRLFVNDFQDDSVHGWNKIKNKLMETDGGLLEVHISSYGGYVKEGIELYNIINTKYQDAQAYLNYGYSMGALTFLMFKERIVYEHSDIMFHNWSGGLYGKAQDMEDRLNHDTRHLNRFFAKLMEPYFSKKEIKKIIKGKEFWCDSRQMLERGIATGIIKDGEYYNTKDYLEKYDKNGNIKKKWQKKQDKLIKEQEEQMKAIQEALEGVPNGEQ
jgi:ATP-dependent protease ClpP protease subunit